MISMNAMDSGHMLIPTRPGTFNLHKHFLSTLGCFRRKLLKIIDLISLWLDDLEFIDNHAPLFLRRSHPKWSWKEIQTWNNGPDRRKRTRSNLVIRNDWGATVQVQETSRTELCHIYFLLRQRTPPEIAQQIMDHAGLWASRKITAHYRCPVEVPAHSKLMLLDFGEVGPEVARNVREVVYRTFSLDHALMARGPTRRRDRLSVGEMAYNAAVLRGGRTSMFVRQSLRPPPWGDGFERVGAMDRYRCSCMGWEQMHRTRWAIMGPSYVDPAVLRALRPEHRLRLVFRNEPRTARSITSAEIEVRWRCFR